MIDPDLESPRRPARRKARAPAHDWSHPAVRPLRDVLSERALGSDFAWLEAKRGLLADPPVCERLMALFVRRTMDRRADEGFSPAERAKLSRARRKQQRQEFAIALGLTLGKPFHLDEISRPLFPDIWRERQHIRPPSSHIDREPVTACLHGVDGPAAIVTQPHYMQRAVDVMYRDTVTMAWSLGLVVVELPAELGWIDDQRALLLWMPDPDVEDWTPSD